MVETKPTSHVLKPIEDYYVIVDTTANALLGSLAKKKVFFNKAETKQDLYQEGMVALIECYNRYSEDKKVVFLTYALHRVRGKMLDYLRTKDTMSRTSRAKFKKISNDFKNKVITLDEKDSKLHEINSMLTVEFQYLTPTVNDSSAGANFSEIIPIPAEWNEHEQVEIKHMVNRIVNENKTLTDKERYVITNYYFKEKNFKSIAKELDVLESRISQIHVMALTKLKNSIGVK